LEVFSLKNVKLTTVPLLLVMLLISLLVVAGCSTQKASEKAVDTAAPAQESVYQRPAEITSADAAIKLLVEGNKRFTSASILKKDLGTARREELATKGQKPFAVILTCSDSRVPPELLFDQALGDLFVIRVAGNVVSPIEMGSIEYGVEHLKAPVVIVLGHENCGAVKATVDGGEAPGSIGSIVDRIKPSVEKAKAAGATGTALYEKTADENINAMIAEINKSAIIHHLEESGAVKVVGAKYFLSSGEVVFNPAK